MCGIVGYIGREQAAPIVVNALKKLEYRGYDSAGLATITNSHVCIKKDAGTLAEVNTKHQLNELPGVAGIGHVRWATHGAVTADNAHPHLDCNHEIAIVHNGIKEVYQVQHSSPLRIQIVAHNDSCILPTTVHASHRSCYLKWTAHWRRYGYTGRYTT